MPTELIEVREYALSPLVTGKLVYSLVDATLHANEEAAHAWVSFRIQQDGLGTSVTTDEGTLPGLAWSTVEVNAVEHQISVGIDIEDAAVMMPDFDFEAEAPEPLDDAPLPPDEDPL